MAKIRDHRGAEGRPPRAHTALHRHHAPPRQSTALTALRVCLATVYLWFGSLKLAGVSSVSVLVQATLPWPAPGWLVPAMGAMEIGIGAVFLWGRRLLPAGILVALDPDPRIPPTAPARIPVESGGRDRA